MVNAIETYIEDNLCGKDSEIALKFVSFLKENNCEIIKDNDYWKDKIYYIIKSHGKCVCFIAIKDPDEKNNRWTVWSDDIDSAMLDSSVVDNELKEIAWNHIDHCGSCGSCGGGRHKIIFGKDFNNVCGCTFRFDNPNSYDLKFLCKMVDLMINNTNIFC